MNKRDGSKLKNDGHSPPNFPSCAPAYVVSEYRNVDETVVLSIVGIAVVETMRSLLVQPVSRQTELIHACLPDHALYVISYAQTEHFKKTT